MRFSINTLGCKVNLCESDEISNRLIMLGFQRVDYRNGDPHICIINTCTVTAESDRKARQLTRRMRNTNKEAKIIVTGCFVKQNRKFLEDNKVDLMLDNDKKKDIQGLMESIIKKTGKEPIINKYRETDRFKRSETSCIRYAQKHSRPLIKIQDGCEQNCTYCIIPKVRGEYRSTESVKVIKKVKELEKNGFEEAVLTGIHIGKYGVDLENNYGLDRLVGDILSNTGIKRLRISSIEINEIDDRLLSVISKNRERIAPHFHIPLQSGSDTVLRKMARPYTAEYFTKKVSIIRKVSPDITITTDVMVGFPGESDEDFSSTFKMVEKIGFSKLHVFKYSPRSGTMAFEMKDRV
ncbi:MAG: tRNA (N(6)-L-threonylcarbamoyladenosine(37)-C(2))-methylthiotransferase MtaB, partial [Actinomycetia bacterium]|nr:tRNA (N(6)-L-threonylcarbamoyladenosine(37)-C(2))-methylthiotransferase MtaB [Actinomycetes bacterium]